MDSNIILSYGSKTLSTVISNTFIDRFMADANGGYLKVYVYLLRCHQDPTRTVTIASIADALGEEQKYIRMALKYWDEQGVISITKARNGQITNIIVRDLDEIEEYLDEEVDEDNLPDEPFTISTGSAVVSNGESSSKRASKSIKNSACSSSEGTSSASLASSSTDTTQSSAKPVDNLDAKAEITTPPRPVYSNSTMMAFKKNYSDFAALLKYLEGSIYKAPMTPSDLQLVCYFYEQLEFPTELIGFLYDYCFNTQKVSSTKYIETVAQNWHSSGICNLEQAKHEVESFSSTAQTVKAALGLSDKLKPAETELLSVWSHDYNMSDELIREACDRAVRQTTKPSLNYINKIITDWHSKNVKDIADVQKLDEEFGKKKTVSKSGDSVPSRQPKSAYFQYPQRNYSEQELSDMEKRKLRQSKLCT